MKRTHPEISVCMPVYNSAAYLRECIDSILNQTFADFELLIVDDGSTDNSIEIIESYHDDRIRLIKNVHDYIGSCNILLEEAKGRYMARMDADDIMKPERLATEYAYLEEHPSVDIIGAKAELFGDSTGEIGLCLGKVSAQEMLHANCIAHPTTMMRMESIRRCRLLYEKEFIYAEDYRFWTRALQHHLTIVNIDASVIWYRLSSSQVGAQHVYMQYKNTKLVQSELSRWMSREEEDWAQKNPCSLPKTDKLLTIIIPFLNEREEVARTVKSIRETTGDSVEILVINDQSNDGYRYREDLKEFHVSYVYNHQRLGVAASRDLGVRMCKTPYFLLLDAHMRFYSSSWVQRIVDYLKNNDRCLLCCQTKFLSKNDRDEIVLLKECPQTYGAYLQFHRDKYLPATTWNEQEGCPGHLEEDIAVVLGAGYAASVRYWKYLKGLAGLRYYGSDEAYISMKVWLEGGRCVLLKDVVIGHIYREAAPYKIYGEEEVYNDLLISYLLFPLPLQCYARAISMQKNRRSYYIACMIFKENLRRIISLKKYYHRIFRQPFSMVWKMNLSHDGPDKNITINLLKKIHEYNEFTLSHLPSHNGLFDGKMAVVIWLSHYASYTKENKWFVEANTILKFRK